MDSLHSRFSFATPHFGTIGTNNELIHGFEIALVKSLRASRILPYTPTKGPNNFEVGDKVLVRRGERKPGSKIISPAWYRHFIVKAEDHPRYELRTEYRRRF